MGAIWDSFAKARALHYARRAPGRRTRIGFYPADGVQYGTGRHDMLGTFRVVYEEGHRPSAGAMDFAYMSLALSPISPCGPGFDVQGPGFSGTQPAQVYATQAAIVTGVPLQFAGNYSMPLTAGPPQSKGTV